jgi:hypothetical protein
VSARGFGKAQTRRTIVVNGPDPVGSAGWNILAERTALELSSQGAPLSIRVGMTGSPEKTAYGDLGPLQRFPASYGAKRAFPALSAPSQALPATQSPVSGNLSLRDYLNDFES